MSNIRAITLLMVVSCVYGNFFKTFFGNSPFRGSGNSIAPIRANSGSRDLFSNLDEDDTLFGNGDVFERINTDDFGTNNFGTDNFGDDQFFGNPFRASETTPQPTTKPPTTRAPTTQAPTTRAPTTQAPTTRAPRIAATTTASRSPITNKDIIRPVLTKSEEQRARQAIRNFVDEHKEPDGTHPFNAAILRLSFHDCIGPRGCDGCINHRNIANENLKRVTDPLDALYAKEFENTFTRADFYALAGIVAAEYAAELADCQGDGCIPKVPFKFGRLDCQRAEDQVHIFCPFNDDTEEFLIKEFNGTLTDEDITAIMGGHSVGRVNRDDGDAFDETPDALDTDYYKQLINHANWKQAKGIRNSTDLDKSWMRGDGKLLMLGADISMISDIGNGKDATCNPGPMRCPRSKFRPHVQRFAAFDQKTFIDKFAKGMLKYISKTTPGVVLQDPIAG